MQIERINDNKFKCTLEKRDLDIRNIRLEELAYGTDKARQLFEEMLMKAHDQFGFTHENEAISVEAYPLSQDCLILVISKVSNFDEIDTRFSRFSEKEAADNNNEQDQGLEGVGDLLTKEPEEADKGTHSDSGISEQEDRQAGQQEAAVSGRNDSELRVFTFTALDPLLELSQILHLQYNGVNSLYKDEEKGIYYLVIQQTFHTDEEFAKTCNILQEYGSRQTNPHARYAYCKEHYHCIAEQTALQRLFLF